MDFAGTVVALGDGVDGYSVGDEVYGCAGGLADLPGTLAEYISADSGLIAKKPTNLSMREAAALPLVAITAYEGLTRAAIQEGQKVLVHGGSGGVGHVALQLARHFGAEVYATAGGDEQMALIEQLGATAINYKTESVEQYVAAHTGGAGFDLVFDSVGGANMANSFEAAALDHKREAHAEILRNLTQIVESGGLRPVLDETHYSLADVGQAHARLSSGRAIGKVVVEN